ncbi:MAG: ATP-dependent zinc protease [Bdellovibrionaceae bacterium]|nr:ATP-dependent zinc protease [Pseudobdellovibrionaceae bacterium]
MSLFKIYCFLILPTLLISTACQHVPNINSNSDSNVNEIKAAINNLNECKKNLEDEREKNLRKIIRSEIIPELREIRLYSKKEIKKQKLDKGELLKRTLIGRVEWIETEDGKARFKARVDTGAQTNSLHAFNIKEKTIDGELYVEFETTDSEDKTHSFVDKVIKKSVVKSTSGNSDVRYVVEMSLRFGDRVIKSNVNLNDRTDLKHKFLIGRNLLIGDYLVDVSQSRLLGGKK